MDEVRVVHTVTELREMIAQWRKAGERVALVPTMGALHEGHLELARQAHKLCERIVVSIFVNPTQFAPSEDFSRYPRTLEADVRRLQGSADLVFAPDVAEMYGTGFSTSISVSGPAEAGLEDRFRPDHFRGVATVVAKLFIQALPDNAMFGEKDFQQLRVVTRMARDLDLPVQVTPVPTMRDSDGLALSSRNRFLSAEDRALAPKLYEAMRRCAERVRAGDSHATALEDARASVAAAGFVIDYLELRDAESLAQPMPDIRDGLRLLAAAKLGQTRLIDNIAV